MSYKFVKRVLDTLFAFSILIVTLPLIVIVTLALAIANRGMPFFVQPRPGKDEVVFRLIKFKTMNDVKDNEGNLLPDDLRITTIGNFVRKYSLDELPQMVNVLFGHMSLIGPRPLLVDYLPLYDKTQKRRHEVRPGITGWAQVNGRNSISWKEKFEYDVWYVDHVSFSVDASIFARTIKKVFKAEGIGASGVKTMPKFNGKN
ncbi:MAG: sugar transferase [Flammeovirgaceae bacterium]|jgi:undecaprenyl phosphate N,N'-diacetylbacillosamine 1-phosphate transferase|nr:sugar transferase [Flammeovirgaceae bacterium]